MKVKYVFLVLFASFAFFSCNKKDNRQQDFDYGEIQKGIYHNSYFNFTVKVPTDWAVLNQIQNMNLMNSTNPGNKDASKITTVILLTASQYELGKTDSIFNPNILILAENVKGNTRIRTSSDYLLLTRKALEREPVKREYPVKMISKQNINRKEFATMQVITTDSNKTYNQKYYTVLVNDFALTAILTYSTEDERVILENALGTIKFK